MYLLCDCLQRAARWRHGSLVQTANMQRVMTCRQPTASFFLHKCVPLVQPTWERKVLKSDVFLLQQLQYFILETQERHSPTGISAITTCHSTKQDKQKDQQKDTRTASHTSIIGKRSICHIYFFFNRYSKTCEGFSSFYCFVHKNRLKMSVILTLHERLEPQRDISTHPNHLQVHQKSKDIKIMWFKAQRQIIFVHLNSRYSQTMLF